MEMLVHLNLSVVEVVLDLPEVQTLAIHLMEVKGDHSYFPAPVIAPAIPAPVRPAWTQAVGSSGYFGGGGGSAGYPGFNVTGGYQGPMLVDGEVEVQVDLLVVAHKVLDFLQLIILEVVLQVLGLEVLEVMVMVVMV